MHEALKIGLVLLFLQLTDNPIRQLTDSPPALAKNKHHKTKKPHTNECMRFLKVASSYSPIRQLTDSTTSACHE